MVKSKLIVIQDEVDQLIKKLQVGDESYSSTIRRYLIKHERGLEEYGERKISGED